MRGLFCSRGAQGYQSPYSEEGQIQESLGERTRLRHARPSSSCCASTTLCVVGGTIIALGTVSGAVTPILFLVAGAHILEAATAAATGTAGVASYFILALTGAGAVAGAVGAYTSVLPWWCQDSAGAWDAENPQPQ